MTEYSDVKEMPSQDVVKQAVRECWLTIYNIPKVIMFDHATYQQLLGQWIEFPDRKLPYDTIIKLIAATQAYGYKYTATGFYSPYSKSHVEVGAQPDGWYREMTERAYKARGAEFIPCSQIAEDASPAA